MSTVIESDWENTRLKEEIESLRQQLEMAEACLAGDNALIAGLKNDIAEKDAEIERMTLEHASAYKLVDYWNKKSSASQAREQQLREALEKLSLYVAYNGDDWVQLRAKEALALPQDTTTLEAIITKAGEVMRERCVDVIGPYGNTRYLSSYEEGCEDTKVGIDTEISALPPITLKDLE